MLHRIFLNADAKIAIGNYFRDKRFRFFKKQLALNKLPVKILDVGGTERFWVNRGITGSESLQLTLLNLEKEPVTNKYITSIKGSAVCMPMFCNQQFDIVFSNSVIEHLYNRDNQCKMADEIRRVGRFYFVQTPNKYFPVEPHYVVPFFQYLPPAIQYKLLTQTKISLLKKWDPAFAKQCIDEIKLLSVKDMKTLFPGASFYYEKFFGLIKSITAHNFYDLSNDGK